MVSHLIWIILRGKIIFEENNLLRDGSSSDCNIDFPQSYHMTTLLIQKYIS